MVKTENVFDSTILVFNAKHVLSEKLASEWVLYLFDETFRE
jgi:hypothetical protein